MAAYETEEFIATELLPLPNVQRWVKLPSALLEVLLKEKRLPLKHCGLGLVTLKLILGVAYTRTGLSAVSLHPLSEVAASRTR